MFFRSVTVIIKDPSNKTSTAGLDRYDNYINKVNVANEILQFRSKRLMREVVQRLHADVDYRMEKGLRTDELYNLSPVSVSFINVMPERRISFAVTPRGGNTVTLSAFEGLPSAKESYDVRLNDTLKVGFDVMNDAKLTDKQEKSEDYMVVFVKVPEEDNNTGEDGGEITLPA